MRIRYLAFLGATILLTGCMPAALVGTKPDGGTIEVNFYPGGSILDDLAIIDGTNYFGTAQYQIDDPLGDVGFRLLDDRRVQAECVETGKNFMGDEECKRYEVYRSSFDLLPEGTTFSAPEMF